MILQVNRELRSLVIDPNKHVEYGQELTDNLDMIELVHNRFIWQTYKLYIDNSAQLITTMSELLS